MLTSSTPRVNRRGNAHGIEFFFAGSGIKIVIGFGIRDQNFG